MTLPGINAIFSGFTLLRTGLLFVFLISQAAADFDAAAKIYRQQNYPQAFIEFQSLAKAGDVRAQTALALMYKFGEGTKQDLTASFIWYKQAATQGYAPAAYHTGIMLADGIGTDENNDAAIKWLMVAAKAGFSRATSKLEELNAPRIEAGKATREYPTWSQNWDFKLPVDHQLDTTEISVFTTAARIPSYRVQLGAMSSPATAKNLWETLSENYPRLFITLSLVVIESTLLNNHIYKVQTGPFDSVEQSREFCHRLLKVAPDAGCIPLAEPP